MDREKAMKAVEHLSKTFKSDCGDLVLEKDIYFSSTCEHHLMPFSALSQSLTFPTARWSGFPSSRARSRCFPKDCNYRCNVAGNFPEDKKREVLALIK